MKVARPDTQALLRAWRAGDRAARDALFADLYPELAVAAAGLLRFERDASISAADLVNDAVLRLIRLERIQWQDRAHFVALAARLMRQLLVDRARGRRADKRAHHRVELNTKVEGEPILDVLELEDALRRLESIDQNYAEIVEMRYFGGMTLGEIAEVQKCSEITVKRRWRAARAWLLANLLGGSPA